MRQLKLLPGFTNVGVATRANLEIPKGVIYHAITLTLTRNGAAMTTAQMLTDISSIAVKVNDNVIQDWTPAELIKINATSGAQFATRDGYLAVWFSRPDRRTMEGEEIEGWGTSDIQNFTMEIQFAGAATPTVTAHALTDTAPNRPLRNFVIRHIKRHTLTPSASGEFQFDKIIKGVNIYYARVHFFSSLVDNVKVSVDDRIVWHNPHRLLVGELLAQYALVKQTDVYPVVFDLSGQLTDQLATFYPANGNLPAAAVSDLRWDVTVSAAGSFTAVLEQYRYLT